jgi:signal transduction histidine kinase
MNVSKLGEQVRRIQQALDIDRQWVALDPEPLVIDLAERFRSNHPEATIRVSSDDPGAVVADELLKIAIENLIENAVEHHPGTATVDIELTVDGGWVDITVADDGPGIPERERAVVSGTREITQLDHSVGLGLWLSRWIVSGVDGRLLFGDCERGSEVTLRLRRADDRDGD